MGKKRPYSEMINSGDTPSRTDSKSQQQVSQSVYLSNKKKSKPMIIGGDRRLLPRIRQLLDANAAYPDEDSIADTLRDTYPEYQRKPRSVLKKSVVQALCIFEKELDNQLVRDKKLAESQGKPISEDESDTEQEERMKKTHKDRTKDHLNNSLASIYANQASQDDETSNDGSRSETNKKHKAKVSIKAGEKKATQEADEKIDALLKKRVSLRDRFLIKPRATYSDFGGIANVMTQIRKLLLHLKHPEFYITLGIEPPRGFLLHGPPGVGKTALVEAIAHDIQVPLLKCGATELVAGISGESESKIRELFSLAQSLAPCILFIDEIDSITSRREQASRAMEQRIVTQLLTSLDNLGSSRVLVVGATNRPESIDSALRRAGRFDREISIGIPDESARKEILQVLLRGIKIQDNFDYESLARKTPGYVGADLKSLIREAAIFGLERSLGITSSQVGQPSIVESEIDPERKEQLLRELCVTKEDFDLALKQIQPSAKREGFATVPDVTWNDIGALHNIREELQLSILAPVKYKKDVQSLGLTNSVGILLCGPPGCGKTLLAKAVANESGINFISVKGPELLNMYVGESERAVRAVFSRARDSSPCVIFFDEIDALCPKRSDSEISNPTSRVVNQLLTEMDGLEARDCFLLAATNRPDILDPAILRPGRFDKIIYVGLPRPEERYEILSTLTRNGTRPPLDPSVNLKQIASDDRLVGFTGADLRSLVREASICGLKEKIKTHTNDTQDTGEAKPVILKKSHFEEALTKIKPSVSSTEMIKYELMAQTYS